jgi:hypothetical protein
LFSVDASPLVGVVQRRAASTRHSARALRKYGLVAEVESAEHEPRLPIFRVDVPQLVGVV